MTRNRGRRDKIRTLERLLGFYTERGLHRTRNADLPPGVKRMLDAIDKIKTDYFELSEDGLRSSEGFDKAWRDLFWDVGPQFWPEVNPDHPAPVDPGYYNRPLVLLEPNDRRILEANFSQLVIEKCLTYQRNQAAKPYRQIKAAEVRHRKHGDQVSGTKHGDSVPRGAFWSPSPSERSATPSISSDDDADEQYDSDTSYVSGSTDKSTEHAMLESPMARSGRQSTSPRGKPLNRVDHTIDPRNLTKRHRQDSDDDDGRRVKRPYHDNGTSEIPSTTSGTISRSDTQRTATNDATPANGFRPINENGKAPTLKPLESSRPPGTTACEPCRNRKVRCDGTRSKCHFRVRHDAGNASGDSPSTESAEGRKRLVIKLAVPRSSSSTQIPSVTAGDAMKRVPEAVMHLNHVAASTDKPAIRPSTASAKTVSRNDSTGRNEEEMIEESRASVEKHKGSPPKVVEPTNKRILLGEQLQQSSAQPPAVIQNGFNDQSDPKRLSTQNLNPASAPEQASTPKATRKPSPLSAPVAAHRREPTFEAHDAAPRELSRFSEGASHPVRDGDQSRGTVSVPAQIRVHPVVENTGIRQEIVQSLKDSIAAFRRGQGAQQSNNADSASAERMGKSADGRSDPDSHVDRQQAIASSSHPVSPTRKNMEPAQPSTATPGATESGLDDALEAHARSSPKASRNTGAFELPHQDHLTTEAAAAPSDDRPVAAQPRSPDVPEQTPAASLPPVTPAINTPTPVHTPIDAKCHFLSAETSSSKTELVSGLRASSTTPSTLEDSKPAVATPTPSAGTGMIVLVDWIHKDGTMDAVARLTRYKQNLWNAVKVDMPASFQSKKFAGLVPGTVRISAADALEQYGESIASEGMEDCLQFLMDEAFGDEGSVERTWRKATVKMTD